MAKKPEGPPKTRFQRSKVIGEVAASAAGKKLKSEVQAVFLPVGEREAHRAKAREEIAAMVFDGLSKLRGTALKLAQVFCADTGLLPDEYLRRFEQAHYQAPGLSPALVRSVLRRELKREPAEVFAEFNWTPSAAASLGQVHQARLHDGRAVAVKVQYPGMQESLASDLSLARGALKPLLRTRLILATLEQLEKRMMEEIDYRKELAQIQWFRAQSYPFPLRIPEPYAEFTTSRVLTMQWMRGTPIDAWVRTQPAQDVADRLAQNLLDLFIISVFERRRFHSDPNLGNFFVADDGGLVLLDFGAVTSLPEDEVAFYKRLWYADGQMDALLREYKERGADTSGRFWDECALPYIWWIRELTANGGMDFNGRHEYVAEGYRLFTSKMFNPRLQEYSDQLTLAHRTLLGIFALLTRLKAKVRLRHGD